ncbi:MAG: cytochrome C oxidase subunit IV family protein [Labilithrix sp.]|nr:cytochrome C oxidase subunit IV family protein [Labilithrix sp.]
MASLHEGHGHDEGAVHAHISSSAFYIFIFVCLLGLTGLTVGQSYVDLGRMNIVLVILIATMKASLVVSFFMHLKYDNRFNALIFISTLFFIGVFFAYTMNDTDRRGDLDVDQNVRLWQKTGEQAPGGMEVDAGDHGGGDHGGAAAPAAPAHH